MASPYLKEFSPFALDESNQCLWRMREDRDPERILLKPKAHDILRHLVNHAGRLVTQDELLDAVWTDTHVQPEVLKRHVFDIRHALGDDPKTPTYIETLSRRGYQFIAPVRDAVSAAPSGEACTAQTDLVGREQALGELRAHLGKTLGGQRQLVFVTGEPGLGKTALVDEFERQVAATTPVRIARGQCVEGFSGREAYYPILEAVGNLCRGPKGSLVIRTLATQAPTLLAQFPALLERQDRERLQRELLGDTKQRMLREIAGALETLAAETPLLLVLEDLHWADPSTVDLLSALARGRGAAKLMVVGTYRPADLAFAGHPLRTVERDLVVHHLCHELALEALDEREIAAWLAGESAGAAADDLAALLYRHSEGNPLFMVAVLEHLREKDAVSQQNGRWQLRVPVEEIGIEVPENLRQMIELQMDRLSEEERRALETACVSGELFSTAVCAQAAAMGIEEFEAICGRLSRWNYLSPSKDQEGFRFAHALYREVLYRRQPHGRRTNLHAPELVDHVEKSGARRSAAQHRQPTARRLVRSLQPMRTNQDMAMAAQVSWKVSSV